MNGKGRVVAAAAAGDETGSAGDAGGMGWAGVCACVARGRTGGGARRQKQYFAGTLL